MFDAIWSLLLVEGDYKYIVVGRESGAIEKYSVSNLKGKPILSLTPAHKASVTTLFSGPNGGDEIFSASLDKSICQWNLTDDTDYLATELHGKRLVKSTLTTAGIRCGLLTAGNELMCFGGGDGNIHVVRSDGSAPERWIGHTDAISCIAQCQTEGGDFLIASGSYDGQIKVWNALSGSVLFTLAGHTSQLKGVQFINGHLGIVGVGRDDTVRLWLLPEELDVAAMENGTGGGGADEEDGGEDEEDAEEGDGEHDNGGTGNAHGKNSATDGQKRKKGTKLLQCSGVIGLPFAPLCLTIQPEAESPLLAIGLSGGSLATIKTNKMFSAVSTFTRLNNTEVRRERKRLDALLKTEERKELAARRKSVKAKKKALFDEQNKEVLDAKNKLKEERQAAKQAQKEAAPDEEDEEDEEHEEGDDNHFGEEAEGYDEEEAEEGDEGPQLTEERQKVLDDFKEELKKSSDEKLKTLRASVNERRRLLDPIAAKKFERTPQQFNDLAFSRYHSRAAEESIVAIVFNGAKAIVASGNTIKVVDSTPGVQNL